MKKIIRKFIKEQIKSLHEGRRVVKVYQSWKRGEKANLNDLGEGNYGFDPRAIAQYFTPDGIAKEDVSVFGMSNGSVELHASSDKDKFHEAKGKDLDGDGDIDSDDYLKAKDNAIKKATSKKSVKEEDVDESQFPKAADNKDVKRRLGAKTGFAAGDGGAGDDLDDDTVDKKATKKAKKAAKGVKGIENEIAKKKDEKKSLKAKVDPLIAKFKAKELDKEAYMKKVGDIPKRIKALNDEIAKLEKDSEAAALKETDDMREVAATAMGRDVNRRLLEIIKEAGAPLHEGAAGVKMHYDIARKAYMEGLTAGLNKD